VEISVETLVKTPVEPSEKTSEKILIEIRKNQKGPGPQILTDKHDNGPDRTEFRSKVDTQIRDF